MGEFTVTTDRRGSRTFGEHDDRWTRGRGSGRYNSGSRGYRGGGGGGYSKPYRGRRNYRGYSGSRGRGSYQSRDSRGRGRGGADPRSRVDEDGDLVMGDEDSQQTPKSRYSPYGRPSRNNYRNNQNYGDSSNYGDSNQSNSSGMSSDKLQRLGLPLSSRDNEQWHRITIPFGKKWDKSFILQNITNHVDIPFVPTYYHYEDNKAIFYVSDKSAAMAILRVNKRVTLPNGYKMIIIIKQTGPPVIPMGAEEIEKLKVCMSNRYTVETKALNLSSMYQDQELQQQDLYMALARDQVMSNVVKIISENIPEIVCLDLSDNKLFKLEILKGLVSKTPGLTMLNFSNNKLGHVDELRKISGWKLEVLNMDGNPFCDKFNDQTSYIR